MKINKEDYKCKVDRIINFLSNHQYDGMIIGRRDNFSWFTNGAENGVLLNSEIGFSYLYISSKELQCISLLADCDKAKEELLKELKIKHVPVSWLAGTKEDYLSNYIKDKRVISDIQIKNAIVDVDSIYQLHYPLTKSEITAYQEIGEIADLILFQTALKIKKGMTELEVKSILRSYCAKFNIDIDVLLIGSDERIFKYRHCTPTDKKIDEYVMISPVFRKYGLHVNIARLLHIGEPPKEIQRKYEEACQIQASILAMSKEGVYFKDIFNMQKTMYEDYGYSQEWNKHMHGAPTGYMVSDGGVLFDAQRKMCKNQAYEWYVTISGVKSAELVVNINNQIKILSTTGHWKCKPYKVNKEIMYLPEIMII